MAGEGGILNSSSQSSYMFGPPCAMGFNYGGRRCLAWSILMSCFNSWVLWQSIGQLMRLLAVSEMYNSGPYQTQQNLTAQPEDRLLFFFFFLKASWLVTWAGSWYHSTMFNMLVCFSGMFWILIMLREKGHSMTVTKYNFRLHVGYFLISQVLCGFTVPLLMKYWAGSPGIKCSGCFSIDMCSPPFRHKNNSK